jgi:hypothetical protein
MVAGSMSTSGGEVLGEAEDADVTMAAPATPAAPAPAEDVGSSPEVSSPDDVIIKNPTLWAHFTQGPLRAKRMMERPGKSPKMRRPDRRAICNYCPSVISRTGGTTSSMRSHLQAKHPGAMKVLLQAELKAKKSLDKEQSDLEGAYEATDSYRGERLRKFNCNC